MNISVIDKHHEITVSWTILKKKNNSRNKVWTDMTRQPPLICGAESAIRAPLDTLKKKAVKRLCHIAKTYVILQTQKHTLNTFSIILL